MENELVNNYRKLSNEQLSNVLNSPQNYTEEAFKAAQRVLNERGDIKQILEEDTQNKNKNSERKILTLHIRGYYNRGLTPEQISAQLKPQFLNAEEFEKLIVSVFQEIVSEKDNLEIKNRTIGASIIGGIAGLLINASLIFLLLYFFRDKEGQFRFPLISLVALFLFSYAPIRIISKQNYKNVLVLIVSILATVFGVGLGYVIYALVGLPSISS